MLYHLLGQCYGNNVVFFIKFRFAPGIVQHGMNIRSKRYYGHSNMADLIAISAHSNTGKCVMDLRVLVPVMQQVRVITQAYI